MRSISGAVSSQRHPWLAGGSPRGAAQATARRGGRGGGAAEPLAALTAPPPALLAAPPGAEPAESRPDVRVAPPRRGALSAQLQRGSGGGATRSRPSSGRQLAGPAGRQAAPRSSSSPARVPPTASLPRQPPPQRGRGWHTPGGDPPRRVGALSGPGARALVLGCCRRRRRRPSSGAWPGSGRGRGELLASEFGSRDGCLEPAPPRPRCRARVPVRRADWTGRRARGGGQRPLPPAACAPRAAPPGSQESPPDQTPEASPVARRQFSAPVAAHLRASCGPSAYHSTLVQQRLLS